MRALPQEIELCPIWLINSSEIPEQFRFSDINDPRLNDLKLLGQYSDWLCDKMKMPRHSCIDKEMIQGNLLFMQDREKAKQAFKFLIMHELGHIHNKDSIIKLIEFIGSILISVSWPICVAIVLTWPIIPFVVTAAAISFIFLTVIRLMLHKNREINADVFAAKHCPDTIDGGIHLFQTASKERELMLERELKPIKGNYMSFLEPLVRFNSTPKYHPSFSSRIAVLEELKQQHCLSQRNGVRVPCPI